MEEDGSIPLERQGDMGTPQPQVDMGDASGLGSRKRARNGGTSSASRRHIQTEQKRRDKINEGYQELQKLLGVENIEKAQLLMQAADYTRQLQAAMRQLLDLKGPAKLSDEVQWSIRMLLPKPGLTGSASGSQQAAVAHGAGDGTGINNALAVLAEHAQQVASPVSSTAPHQPATGALPAPAVPAAAGVEGAVDPNMLQNLLTQLQAPQQQAQAQPWQGVPGLLQTLQLTQLLNQPHNPQAPNLAMLLGSQLANAGGAAAPQGHQPALQQVQPQAMNEEPPADSGTTASSGSRNGNHVGTGVLEQAS
ncbi:hypothetical protein CVIRNUC_008448 [Coccomyxa viridis]|uniref:BHLH domain-containing protein n=1 Tax=Coccomyxa viridis TaxID=1274662 RepID=A0AAV1IF00_9CHLO|nr:hypothetical protein CVIRNUC_008448 [Coccomyxa viridis]